MTIGFVGTGTISGAVVEGLQRAAQPPSMILSPRSEAVSSRLAALYPNIRRAASNAEAAAADIVVLGMRPTQVEEALAGITFGADQLVLSLVAGLSLADVQQLAPHSRVDRAIPMPGVARGAGPVLVYPGLPETVALLGPIGDLVVCKVESQLTMGGLTGFMSSYFELQHMLIERAVAAGVGRDEARKYVLSMLAMLSGTANLTPPDRFDELVAEHQTKGGLNERVRRYLLDAGWFDVPGKAFDEIARLRRENLG